MAPKLTVGDAAPDFRLKADDGREVTLNDFRGRWLVLYFFPKANTPG
jgi:peroxiredoxin Q/BCP